MNFSQKTTVLIIYAINLLFAAASIFYTLKDPIIGRIIYIVIFILVVWFVLHTSIISDKSANLRKSVKKKLHLNPEKSIVANLFTKDSKKKKNKRKKNGNK